MGPYRRSRPARQKSILEESTVVEGGVGGEGDG
jgi:hypothetical protein